MKWKGEEKEHKGKRTTAAQLEMGGEGKKWKDISKNQGHLMFSSELAHSLDK